MRGPDLIYIVMPAVILLALVVLIALPFAAATGSGDRRSAGRHSGGQEPQGQMPGHPARTDAVGSDVAGLGHGRPSVTARAHVRPWRPSFPAAPPATRTPTGSPSS